MEAIFRPAQEGEVGSAPCISVLLLPLLLGARRNPNRYQTSFPHNATLNCCDHNASLDSFTHNASLHSFTHNASFQCFTHNASLNSFTHSHQGPTVPAFHTIQYYLVLTTFNIDYHKHYNLFNSIFFA